MHILTPSTIQSVAWEGELVPPPVMGGSASRPVISLGQPEIWPAAQALENEVGKKWTSPLGGAKFWLLRLACTLREPSGASHITEAEQRLYLRPHKGEGETYAYSLFPDRLGVEDKASFTAKLSPELEFAKVIKGKVGEIGATIEYRKVFPVIQSYGIGEPSPYWVFKPHPAHPLDGSQCVYAVVVAKAGVDSIRVFNTLVVTVETGWGPIRFGLPEEAKQSLDFTIPEED